MIATAQVIADKAAAPSRRPVIDTTANGLPLVQIATPSAAGVSHNQYTQFNVAPAGLILNNSQTVVQTQQAGYVAANPNLANGSARIILNEVTSTSRSQLNGFTEVAGQRAEVIIANPNGISCNGCGFINTSRGVLITGTPVMGIGGSLDAFRVTSGDIQIGTAGLNGSNLTQLDLISRSIQVNGQLWAANLNVITGANLVNYNTLGVQVIQGTGNKPTVGIDVALLGGMYANKIRLVGTEAGVGVNSLGYLSAQAGDFILDSQGQITLNGGTTASGNISVSSGTGIINSGAIYSKQAAQLTSAGSITNTGLLSSQGNLTLGAASVNSTGTMGAGIDINGNVSRNGSIFITTQNQTVATGTNIAGGSMNIAATDINLANSKTNALSNITLKATGNLINTSGRIGSNQDLFITANTIIGNGQAIAGRDATIGLQGNYTNAAGNVFKANRNLTFSTTGNLVNQATLEAVGAMLVSAANIDNQTGAFINANLNKLTATGDITNAGRIEGNTVETHSNNFTNSATVMGGVLNLYANNLSNLGSNALIAATQTVNLIVANTLNNQSNALESQTTAQNRQVATIYSLGDINIGSNLVLNAAGYLTGNTASVNNQSATIEAAGNLRISAAAIANKRTVVGVEWGPSWTGAYVAGNPRYTPTFADQRFTAATTAEAQLLSGANMLISGGTLVNDYSSIIAGGTLQSQLTQLTNSGAAFQRRETRVGVQDVLQWQQTGTNCILGAFGVCLIWGGPIYGWVQVTIPYAQTITTNISGQNFTNRIGAKPAGTVPAVGNQAVTPTALMMAPSANPGALPALSVPAGGLYSIHSQPGQKYLVVTDPRFANYANFVSSDYMLSRLTLDPQRIQKRLGDGYYEQKLVTDQITALTGRRYLASYADAQSQFMALLDAGVDAANELQLVPGIALNAKQVNALTHDMVWMVERDVILPNGTSERVLAPEVYLSRLHGAELKPSGALIAANDIRINAKNSIYNSGSIQGRATNVLAAKDIVNRDGAIGSQGFTLLKADNDILNLSGKIGGKNVYLSAGRDIRNERTSRDVTSKVSLGAEPQYGTGFAAFFQPVQATGVVNGAELGLEAGIGATGTLSMNAGRDISVIAAMIDAGGNATVNAGRDLNVGVLTTTESASTSQYAAYRKDVTQHTSSIKVGGNLDMRSGNDMHLTSASLDVGNDATLIAGGNLTLDASKNSSSLGYDTGYVQSRTYDETVVGTTLNAGGNIALAAVRQGAANGSNDNNSTTSSGGDSKGNIKLASAAVSSKNGYLALIADNNVNIGTVDEKHESFKQERTDSSNWFSSKTTTTRDERKSNDAIGSSLDGDSLFIQSGRDINVKGSNLVASNDVTLNAGNNITLTTAENISRFSSYKDEQTSGIFSDGGSSITLGTKQQTDTQKGQSITHTGSTVGSVNGNVTIEAGKHYNQTGSNLTTPKGAIDITAQSVLINAVQNSGTSTFESQTRQTGLTVSAGNAVVSAVQTAQQMQKAASQTSSDRMKGLAAANAAMSAYSAYNAVSSGISMPDGNLANKVGGIDLSFSLGTSSSQSTSTQSYSQAMGSNLNAGGNIDIRASGAGKDSNLTILGSKVKAEKNTTFEAENEINLLVAQNTSSQASSNSSSSSSIGAGISLGAGGAGVNLNVAANGSWGNTDGSDLSWANAHVDAGQTLTLKSGGDTNLKGAVAGGKHVVADIGGNLNIESLQDISSYRNKQDSAGFSVSVPISGSGFGANINASKTSVDSSYASVTEQSGFKAGDDGYQVKVKGDTGLKGGVIASTGTGLAQSSFSTGGALKQSDISNRADYSADSTAYGGGIGSQLGASGGTGSDSGHAQSITRSGIGVSTGKDTTGAIKPIFDAQKVTEDVNAQVQITQNFSQQAPKAVANFSGAQAQNLRDRARDKSDSDPEKQALLEEAKKWDEGGIYRVALHTVSGALSGGANGAAGALTTASAAPLMDELQSMAQAALEAQGVNPKDAKMMAQGLAQITSASMGAAVGGAQGAATGLTVDTNNRQLHPSEIAWINEHAKDYAKNRNISIEQAKEELTQQALRSLDAAWASKLGNTPNAAAQNFLNTAQDSYENYDHKYQKYFTTTAGDYMNGTVNAYEIAGNADYLKFYRQYAQSGIKYDAWTGLAHLGVSKAKDTAQSFLGDFIDGVATVLTTNPLKTGKAIVTGAIDSANGAGKSLAGSAIVISDSYTRNLLNDIYGDKDASKLVAVIAAMPAATMIGGAALGGPIVRAVQKVLPKKEVGKINDHNKNNTEHAKTETQEKNADAQPNAGNTGHAEVKQETKANDKTSHDDDAKKKEESNNKNNTELTKTEAPKNKFNGKDVDPDLPPPDAGWGYKVGPVNNAKTENQKNAHKAGLNAETDLANEVVKTETVVKWGGKVGTKGSDIISVNLNTNQVTLWDSKYRSKATKVDPSRTFTNSLNLNNNIISEAEEAIKKSNLPQKVKNAALKNLEDGKFTSKTVGAGSAKNFVQIEYVKGLPDKRIDGVKNQ